MPSPAAAGVHQACPPPYAEGPGPDGGMSDGTAVAGTDDQGPRADPQKPCRPARAEQILVAASSAWVHGAHSLDWAWDRDVTPILLSDRDCGSRVSRRRSMQSATCRRMTPAG